MDNQHAAVWVGTNLRRPAIDPGVPRGDRGLLTAAVALAELDRQHLDILARTAADEHGIAEIEDMSEQARAIGLALRDLRG